MKEKKEFLQVLTAVSMFIDKEAGDYKDMIELNKDIQDILKSKNINPKNIKHLLESISMAKEFANCDDYLILDYDYLVDYISDKTKEEQVLILEILIGYLSNFFRWKTNDYHCIVELYQIAISDKKSMEQ